MTRQSGILYMSGFVHVSFQSLIINLSPRHQIRPEPELAEDYKGGRIENVSQNNDFPALF